MPVRGLWALGLMLAARLAQASARASLLFFVSSACPARHLCAATMSQPSDASAIVTCSAPGKVLVVGGYLVLEEGTPGLVVSASARLRAALRRCAGAPPAAAAGSADDEHLALTVISPQFSARWHHRLRRRR